MPRYTEQTAPIGVDVVLPDQRYWRGAKSVPTFQTEIVLVLRINHSSIMKPSWVVVKETPWCPLDGVQNLKTLFQRLKSRSVQRV